MKTEKSAEQMKTNGCVRSVFLHNSLLLLFLFIAWTGKGQHLQEQIAGIEGVTGIERLEFEHFKEKYLVRLTQPVDHRNKEAGTFTQRVIVSHVGYDRPTILVTEGYGAEYALNPRYREELSTLLDANMIFVEYRYFLESTPDPCNWDYLTAENSAYDLHAVNQAFRRIYTGKWISTGISKGGQTTCLYRAFFPDDVDFSVPYVAPLNRAVEDERNERFLKKVGTRSERKKIKNFQLEILKRKTEILPLLEAFGKEKQLQFRIPMAEVLDFCVLEYPFALWQWGTSTEIIPPSSSDTETLFRHLTEISGPDYFSEGQSITSFFVQAARELGYYGYDTKPFKKYLTIKSSKGYLNRIMLPRELENKIDFRPELYHKVYDFLKDNDPKMIFIYGECDPWSATRVPTFRGKKNQHIYIQPGGSHRARIGNMPDETKKEIIDVINGWLAE